MKRGEVGRLGEESAALYLMSNGYKIVGRRVHLSHSEIDIIAENDTYLVFAEVKARRQYPTVATKYGLPSDSITEKKKESLIRGAELYIKEHPSDRSVRIDVIEVYIDPASEIYKVLKLIHHENAIKKHTKFSR